VFSVQRKRIGNCEVVTNGIRRPRIRKTGVMRAMNWEGKRYENIKFEKQGSGDNELETKVS